MMLAAFSKSRVLSTRVISTIKTVPRLTTAFLHTQSTPQETTIDPSIHSLGARLGLQTLDPIILKQALTHKSVDEQVNNNASLEFIGKRVVGLFATEYIHCKYPNLYPEAFVIVLSSLINNTSFSKIATEVGLQHCIAWKPPTVPTKNLGQNSVLATCMNAIVGAIFQEQGIEAAKKFVHDFILSRDFDISPALKTQIKEPKRYLSALLRQMGMKPAESRLLSETGRLSCSPVFIVGTFSGKEKLGEGFGSSIKMAEFRACQDALLHHFGKEYKDFVLPSDADKVEKYVPAPLGKILPII
ncbi:ribonuclease III domain-containing protein [Cokeromyces recurvatus]|uniref:ribonuclease III domain-containing protein n=1 Tax=Cokeromyces recurvatus TaxID=90255 RepID=UPI00221E4780|nr:ribonuclease III domain-containing protein [Cokeromyces recurvatus]KAI7900601.1 ribonuclease III domain-containing protein [Cokeromyces recurvatus]